MDWEVEFNIWFNKTGLSYASFNSNQYLLMKIVYEAAYNKGTANEQTKIKANKEVNENYKSRTGRKPSAK